MRHHSRESELAHTTVHLVRHGHVIWTPDEDRVLSPEGREGAEYVAMLLAGDKARFLTGQSVTVDGGMTTF